MNANLPNRAGALRRRTARNVYCFAGVTDEGRAEAKGGWLLYDAACPFCARLARRIAPALESRGVGILPLQTEWVRRLLAARREPLLKEVRFLGASGRLAGGADAILAVLGSFWWARPVCVLAKVPGVCALLRRGYALVAEHRHCLVRAPRKHLA